MKNLPCRILPDERRLSLAKRVARNATQMQLCCCSENSEQSRIIFLTEQKHNTARWQLLYITTSCLQWQQHEWERRAPSTKGNPIKQPRAFKEQGIRQFAGGFYWIPLKRNLVRVIWSSNLLRSR